MEEHINNGTAPAITASPELIFIDYYIAVIMMVDYQVAATRVINNY